MSSIIKSLSYMTQLKEITFTENNQAELVLSNDQHIPISRRYLKVFKEALGLC
ncbi:Transcriptional regulatory protein YehT [Arsenophonus endosymbiont of Bemisia tabaci Q2]|nr:Transcriptional regulatory protein YehT [Arsenophonus endosymbiont of Bemisia tabaci Q2]